jgi:hypothetical protein
MSVIKAVLIASTLALGFAGTASATEGTFTDGMIITVNPDGRYAMGRATRRGIDAFMKSARQLPGGTTVMRYNGHFYIAEDPRGTLYQMFRDANMHAN